MKIEDVPQDLKYFKDVVIRDQEYAVDEIKSAIKFVEEQTGEKWDWDYYFECAINLRYTESKFSVFFSD